MTRIPRAQSESGFYHVYVRGNGRQLIFEDDRDRRVFLQYLGNALTSSTVELFAYCLMDNHYHLVVKAGQENLATFARDLNRSYAVYFNRAHERTGHVFQDRYSSEPIENDSYFLSAIRYVHRNPVEARMTTTCSYRWSSYDLYLNEAVDRGGLIVNTDMAINMLGGIEVFREFHSHPGKETFAEDCPYSESMETCEMIDIARTILNGYDPAHLKSLPKQHRDRGLRLLKSTELSLSQIAQITGISRSTIHRA